MPSGQPLPLANRMLGAYPEFVIGEQFLGGLVRYFLHIAEGSFAATFVNQ